MVPAREPRRGAGVRGSTIEDRGIAIDRLIHKKHHRGPAVHLPALISTTCRMASRRSAAAATRQGGWDESPVRRRFRGRSRRSCPLFLDLGEQPGLGCGSRPLLLRVIISKTAGREDYGEQLGDAAATTVVEVHKRKASGCPPSKPSDKVRDTHSVGSICDHDFGVFTVANIAMENTDAVPPAHPVPMSTPVES